MNGLRAGLVGVERRGPRGVHVERVGQHPADVLQGVWEQLRDLAVGGGRDRLVDLLPGLLGVGQQRRLGHAGVVAGGDGVQVAAFGREARVGPDLVAGVQRHARAAQVAQGGRPGLQAGLEGLAARRRQMQHAGHGPCGAAAGAEIRHAEPAGQARRRQDQVGLRVRPAPGAEHVEAERGVRRPVGTRVHEGFPGRHAVGDDRRRDRVRPASRDQQRRHGRPGGGPQFVLHAHQTEAQAAAVSRE